jgi:hypothetical protein
MDGIKYQNNLQGNSSDRKIQINEEALQVSGYLSLILITLFKLIHERHTPPVEGGFFFCIQQATSHESVWESCDGIPRTLAVGGDWLASRPDRFTHGKRVSITNIIGGYMGPRTVLQDLIKNIFYPDGNRTTIPRSSSL